jgi:hypothetical protein
MPLQLFSLPEYHQAFERFSWQAMVELMKRKSPVLGMIQSEITEHVPSVRNTLPSGKIIESQPLELKMEFSVEVQDAIHGQVESTIVAIDHAAEQAVKSVMEHFYAYHTRLCEAAGTKTDAKGQPISHDLMLASLEKVDIEFDQDGNALFPTMVMHPSMAEQLRRLPPPTENQIKAFNDLIERKRNDYASRRRDRQLS